MNTDTIPCAFRFLYGLCYLGAYTCSTESFKYDRDMMLGMAKAHWGLKWWE